MGKKQKDLKVVVGIAGLRGCMPQYSGVYASREDAAASLCTLHEYSDHGPKYKELLKWGHVDLGLASRGNEYMEITEYSAEEYLSMNDIKVEEIPQFVQWGELPEELLVLVEEE